MRPWRALGQTLACQLMDNRIAKHACRNFSGLANRESVQPVSRIDPHIV